MNVLVVTGIFPPDPGGPATYVPNIAKALSERGHQITVITLSDSLVHDDTSYPFAVIRILRGQSKLRRVPETIWRIARHAERADVVFANGLFIEAAIAARWEQKPLVMKIVGDWAWERSVNNGWTSDAIETFQRKFYSLRVESVKHLRSIVTRAADWVFTPSQYLSRIVSGWGVEPERLQTIYNALEPPHGAQAVSLPPFEGHTLITVARLVAWKGVDRILHVVATLPNVRLVVVGDGPERKSLMATAEDLQIQERVIFTGQLQRNEVEAYMRAADVFVLNSTYEGLPHVVLEAMAIGLPVIATDVGGTGEVALHGTTGLLIPPNDDEALRLAICRMLELPEMRQRFIQAGQRLVETQFCWAKLVDATDTLLANAIHT